MKFKLQIIPLFILLLISCKSEKKYEPENLSKLTAAELMDRAEKKTLFQINNAVFKNENGMVLLLDSIGKVPNPYDWTTDRYVDSQGEIKELIFRKATEEDKTLQKKLTELYSKKPPIEIVETDCNNLSNILQEVHSLDQSMRTGGKEYNSEIDNQNLITIVSLIKNCGMPTLKEVNEKEMSAIWLVIQHADKQYRKQYFPMLKKSAENGDIKKTQIAIMQDRMLMDDGKPQIYGSQLKMNHETQNLELYTLENPETVNKRRAELGFGPIEDYVAEFGLEFNIKQSE